MSSTKLLYRALVLWYHRWHGTSTKLPYCARMLWYHRWYESSTWNHSLYRPSDTRLRGMKLLTLRYAVFVAYFTYDWLNWSRIISPFALARRNNNIAALVWEIRLMRNFTLVRPTNGFDRCDISLMFVVDCLFHGSIFQCLLWIFNVYCFAICLSFHYGIFCHYFDRWFFWAKSHFAWA